MKKDKHHSRGEPPRKEESVDILGPNSEIGRKLRQYYDGLVSEDVPDRFRQLLGQLEAAESARDGGEPADGPARGNDA